MLVYYTNTNVSINLCNNINIDDSSTKIIDEEKSASLERHQLKKHHKSNLEDNDVKICCIHAKEHPSRLIKNRLTSLTVLWSQVQKNRLSRCN